MIWDVGTTAVTSATASPETCNAKDVATAQFILENYDNLAEETAKGQGAHLTAMFDVLGCQASAHGTMISTVRQNMATNVSQANYTNKSQIEKASDYYNAVNAAAGNSCSA